MTPRPAGTLAVLAVASALALGGCGKDSSEPAHDLGDGSGAQSAEAGADCGTTAGDTAAPSCRPGGPGMSDCGDCRESCCTSLPVAGGTFYRTYENSGSGPTGESDPATVSDFRLDKYLVTMARFLQFGAAWKSGWSIRHLRLPLPLGNG